MIEKTASSFSQRSFKFIHLPSTSFLMAAIAGFIDVIGFIGVNKLFTAHITGNLVIAISEIIDHEPGVAAKIVALPFFILIVGIVTWFIEMHRQTKQMLAIWFMIETLFLVAFLFAGLYIIPTYAVSSWQYICSGMLPVCTMAIHNTLLRTFMVSLPPCTVMTGNLTQWVIDFVGYHWKKTLKYGMATPLINHAEIRRLSNVLLGFLFGGICGAVGFTLIGFWIVILSIVVLLIMAVRIFQ